jgi:hypothetical protein
MKRQIAIEIICFLFILLFVYAAIMKWMDVEKFHVQLGQSPLLMAFADYLVWIVPGTELLIVAMLVFKKTRLIGLYASFTLMVMFTVYIIVILTFADHVPCSCGGILEKMGWTEHLIFNIAFVLMGAAGVILTKLSSITETSSTKLNYAS